MNLKKVKTELKRIDPAWSESDKEFQAAVILLYGSTNRIFRFKDLVRLTKYNNSFVKETVRNIKNNRIWANGKVRHSGWFDEEHGGVSFMIDVTMALGFIRRVRKEIQ